MPVDVSYYKNSIWSIGLLHVVRWREIRAVAINVVLCRCPTHILYSLRADDGLLHTVLRTGRESTASSELFSPTVVVLSYVVFFFCGWYVRTCFVRGVPELFIFLYPQLTTNNKQHTGSKQKANSKRQKRDSLSLYLLISRSALQAYPLASIAYSSSTYLLEGLSRLS